MPFLLPIFPEQFFKKFFKEHGQQPGQEKALPKAACIAEPRICAFVLHKVYKS